MGRRWSESLALLAVALACGGCARGPSVAYVKLDMDRDRWELPRTIEHITLRRQTGMMVRVELVNSSDRPVTILKWDEPLVRIWNLDYTLVREDDWLPTGMCSIGGETERKVEIPPGGSEFHEIKFGTRYASTLPAGRYRLRIMFSMPELQRQFPLLDKWVDLEIFE